MMPTSPLSSASMPGFLMRRTLPCAMNCGIGFIATGKALAAIKQKVAAIPPPKWEEYENQEQAWSYAPFSYQCDQWTRAYRALYTRPVYQDQQLISYLAFHFCITCLAFWLFKESFKCKLFHLCFDN